MRASSLLEVMVASAILLTILTSTASAVAFGVMHVGHSRRVAEAERIAAGQMEALIVEGRLAVPTTDPFGRFNVPTPPSQRGSNRFSSDGRPQAAGDYLAQWTVEEDRPIVGGLRLHVKVDWEDRGARRSLGLTTYYVLPDPCDRPQGNNRGGGGGFGGGGDPCDFSSGGP